MADAVKGALIVALGLIIAAVLNGPFYSSGVSKEGVYVVNNFTGRVKFCNVYNCYPTVDGRADTIR